MPYTARLEASLAAVTENLQDQLRARPPGGCFFRSRALALWEALMPVFAHKSAVDGALISMAEIEASLKPLALEEVFISGYKVAHESGGVWPPHLLAIKRYFDTAPAFSEGRLVKKHLIAMDAASAAKYEQEAMFTEKQLQIADIILDTLKQAA
jgi:hypothetical protein